MSAKATIAVLGAGSWGTALAILLARNGHAVTLWGHEPPHMAALAETRVNAAFLPGAGFPDNLTVTDDLALAARGTGAVLVAVPSHAFREVLRQLAAHAGDVEGFAWATKGLEHTSGKLLHSVFAEEMGEDRPCAVISGPTFAGEVAQGLPTAVTVASMQSEHAQRMAQLLTGASFRAYTSNDVIGVEIGGAVKNTLAIAAGIADGLGFGANARAALITRGLAEVMRLGTRMGGQRETFMGLAGLGDLVLTCTDNQSRNRRFGLALAGGVGIDDALQSIGQVVEGIQTAREVRQLAEQHQVDMPIAEQVHKILFEGVSPRAAVHSLLGRELKAETH